ncbi:hypothetical protein T03_9855 [Trichinella britovi]|uniref:Uncharacterized protein n=1 Tax=Trichinella britovi TaxID=45882 RepID=A0A0V1AKQ0_TRIBR|nr:hypothetical protein T03_9855 [Trichinella britovi]
MEQQNTHRRMPLMKRNLAGIHYPIPSHLLITMLFTSFNVIPK